MPFAPLEDDVKGGLEKQLLKQEKKHPPPKIMRFETDEEIPEGTPVVDLVVVGGVAELEIHPEMEKVAKEQALQQVVRPPPIRGESVAPA